ncbi:MAG: glycerol-3-phosphate 1-O-acyltransferase PlsY [Hydrogenophilales bacterium]|nr:glycerol-3-phosphate 1-O-acyltransferase PlsY [Hydrogenophilales bacterium]
MLEVLIVIVVAYLIGSLSFAVILSRVSGLPDPRSYGSGNPGATNVLRSGRKSVAALTLLGDALKGAVAVLLAQWATQVWGLPSYAPALAGLAAFVGHLWPVFFGFKGGKGVATALGLLMALNPWLGFACAASWLLVFLLTRVSSLSALVAAGLAPVYVWWLSGQGVDTLAILGVALLIFWRHKANIGRLLRGEEAGFKRS